MNEVSTATNRGGVKATMDNVPLNQWYAAGGAEEFGREIVARRLLGKRIVMYRTENGDPVAMDDRCPHRFMALSKGQLLGDDIECPYHGFRFGPSGHCTLVPSISVVPRAMRTRSYPLVEKYGFVWIWMGDEALADVGLIPEIPYGHDWYDRTFHFCYPINSNYLRLHENLMDTSHPSFLHEGLFDGGDLAAAPYRTEVEGNVVRLVRDVGPHVPNESTAKAFNLEPGACVRRTLITETHAPCLNIIYNSFTYVDDPTRAPSELINAHPIVPAGPKECYQFVSSISSYVLSQPERLAFEDFFRLVMSQDAMALESIEEAIEEDDPSAIEYSVKPDEASLKLRRMIMDMARAERNAASALN